MSAQPPLTIVSSGVVCSVGLSAPAVFAAIRASITNFKETHFLDQIGQPILGAAVPTRVLGFPEEADGSIAGGDDKLAQMLAMAVAECAGVTGGNDLGVTALLIVAPEEGRLVFSHDGLRRCFTACEAALDRKLHEESRVVQTGSTGLVDALLHARDLLTSHKVQSVLVAGVDSLLGPEDIHEGLMDGRLLVSGSSDGFIPGEAAACVLVTRSAGKSARRAPVLSIAGLGKAEETRSLQGRARSSGAGLAKAMRQALSEAGLPAHEVHARYADVSAEAYFFEEASYGWTRLLRGPSPEGYKLLTPVTRVGHIGAAMGPLILAMVLDEARRGFAAGPNTLVHLSSSGAPRGALVVIAS